MSDIRKLLRPNIASLKPYSSARHEYIGRADIFLDANENPFASKLNRYPDPLQEDLKSKLSDLFKADRQNIFLGNGSDEAIDLLIRSFCVPGEDGILIMPPTYGMYRVCADINGVEVHEAPLNKRFNIDKEKVRQAITSSRIKLIFVCSPNNPTGNIMPEVQLNWLFTLPDKIIVLDEAYVDFAPGHISIPDRIDTYPNVVTLRTMSKAWGLAGARLGMAMASTEIINVLNTVKPPYNINTLTQEAVSKALASADQFRDNITTIIAERQRCQEVLNSMDIVEHVYPSESNFLLVKFYDAGNIFERLKSEGIVVRDRRSSVAQCLRITVGTPQENNKLISTLNKIQ